MASKRRFPCPHCQARIIVDVKFAGKPFRCPTCQTRSRVPQLEALAPLDDPPPPATAPVENTAGSPDAAPDLSDHPPPETTAAGVEDDPEAFPALPALVDAASAAVGAPSFAAPTVARVRDLGGSSTATDVPDLIEEPAPLSAQDEIPSEDPDFDFPVLDNRARATQTAEWLSAYHTGLARRPSLVREDQDAFTQALSLLRDGTIDVFCGPGLAAAEGVTVWTLDRLVAELAGCLLLRLGHQPKDYFVYSSLGSEQVDRLLALLSRLCGPALQQWAAFDEDFPWQASHAALSQLARLAPVRFFLTTEIHGALGRCLEHGGLSWRAFDPARPESDDSDRNEALLLPMLGRVADQDSLLTQSRVRLLLGSGIGLDPRAARTVTALSARHAWLVLGLRGTGAELDRFADTFHRVSVSSRGMIWVCATDDEARRARHWCREMKAHVTVIEQEPLAFLSRAVAELAPRDLGNGAAPIDPTGSDAAVRRKLHQWVHALPESTVDVIGAWLLDWQLQRPGVTQRRRKAAAAWEKSARAYQKQKPDNPRQARARLIAAFDQHAQELGYTAQLDGFGRALQGAFRGSDNAAIARALLASAWECATIIQRQQEHEDIFSQVFRAVFDQAAPRSIGATMAAKIEALARRGRRRWRHEDDPFGSIIGDLAVGCCHLGRGLAERAADPPDPPGGATPLEAHAALLRRFRKLSPEATRLRMARPYLRRAFTHAAALREPDLLELSAQALVLVNGSLGYFTDGLAVLDDLRRYLPYYPAVAARFALDRAELLEWMGQPQEAKSALLSALDDSLTGAQYRVGATMLIYLGDLCQSTGDYDDACELVRQMQTLPDESFPFPRRDLELQEALLYLQLRQKKRALHAVRRAKKRALRDFRDQAIAQGAKGPAEIELGILQRAGPDPGYQRIEQLLARLEPQRSSARRKPV